MAIDIGTCFHREHEPGGVIDQARAGEDAGYDELWVIEDCFYTSGPTLAAAALTATTELTVGIGIMPSVARTAAMTAMECATLARLAPGRFHAGIGHGVQEWMAQMGVRKASPLTALSETLVAVRRLLAGDRVTVDGRYVTLDDVQLQPPPAAVPPVSAGVRGEKSLHLAGRDADGTIFADFVCPTYLRWAAEHIAAGEAEGQNGDARGPGPLGGKHRYTVFASMAIGPDGDAMRRAMTPFLSEIAVDAPPSLRMAPFFDELAARAERSSWIEAVGAMPVEWWHDIAPVGTPDDAAEYLTRLDEAGADAVALFPNPDDPVGDSTQAIAHIRAALG